MKESNLHPVFESILNSQLSIHSVTNFKFTDEMQWLINLLPKRYKCELREKGVHCYDTTGEGINDDHMVHDKYNSETDNQWLLISKAIEQKFGKRLMEIYSQEPQYNSKFTVYLRPE